MNQQPITVIHGSVPPYEPSFRGGEFRPYNEAYSRFTPSEQPVEGPYGAYLEVFEGEWFSVAAHRHSEGPTEFVTYRPAYMRSLKAGEFEGQAYVYICTPSEDQIITATGADGKPVPVFNQSQYRRRKLSRRLVFPNR